MRDFIIKKSAWVLVVIIILSYGVYFYWLIKGRNNIIKPKTEIENRFKKLEADKKRIEKRLDSINNVATILYSKIDSIENLKPKITIKYVTKYNKIDNSNTNDLCKEFERIFTANHVK